MASHGSTGTRGAKRPAQGEEGEDPPLTLTRLLEALLENREEIVAQVRGDIEGLNGRVAAVEQNMDVHVDRTTKLMEAMTDRHCAMENTVKASVRDAQNKNEAVVRRLELLEGKFASANFSLSLSRALSLSLSSTKTSDNDGGGQRPALVAGGWNADQHHEETLDLSQAFVPGLRRGFAIIPLIKYEGESYA